ncbi:16S rRNA pseudouridine(516) synthase [Shewanella sp. OMA3-2]|uniref:16S rRNA pseudouridine(516) synthase n=1 Tax=Shewanella sp. OMA3-2 TaxID=2908650 RepID=UPI001F2F35E3|nr:16S rRNA pseudouridine(516) synthase [Shewanella sp. OMA3-2]UJF21595.1 pseudouridine synthase [Shewanella sp. OMA3-2]
MASKRGRIDTFIAKKLQIPKKSVRSLIANQQLLLNGDMVMSPDTQIDEFSVIECQGLVLQQRQRAYWMLHKPQGVVSATVDEQHQTALDLLKGVDKDLLHIAGRLDLNSTGLLLITNDARWSQALMSPDNKVTKRYLVTLANPIDETYAVAFAKGMWFEYEGITTQAAKLTIVSRHQAIVELNEGKYHQIKRMFGRFNNPVVALHRESIGQIELDNNLQLGEFRALSVDEIDSVKLTF